MSATTNNTEYDVAVIGLGPTGLTLCHFLGRRGLRVLALEREPEFYGLARAVYTDDECMRIFQGAGVGDELAADMIQDSPVQWVLEDGSVLGQLIRLDRPNGWPMSSFLYQPYLENKLEDLLVRYPNVTKRRARELLSFAQDESGVTLSHAASRGVRYGQIEAAKAKPEKVEETRVSWLVACDGGRSSVRTQLGIKMVGRSFPEPWLVVDIKEKPGEHCLRHMPYFNFYCDPKQPTVSCPQPNGHHRFEFQVMGDTTREQMEDPANIRRLLSRHVDPDKFEILRALVYTFNALVAERWHDGRVLLAGDAAHMTPQFMGQGMSSGLRDAYNLAWKLDAVVKGDAGIGLIDSYELERSPHAKEMIDASVRMKQFVSMPNPWKAKLRNGAMRAALATPKLGRWISEARFRPQPTYHQGRYLGVPRKSRSSVEGRLIPQPMVRTFDGRRHLLDEIIGENFALIGLSSDPRTGLDAATLAGLDRLGTTYIALYPFARRPQEAYATSPKGSPRVLRECPDKLIEMEDFTGTALRWFRSAGARDGHVAIMRPDKFVYALAPAAGVKDAVATLFEALGATPGRQGSHAARSAAPALGEETRWRLVGS